MSGTESTVSLRPQIGETSNRILTVLRRSADPMTPMQIAGILVDVSPKLVHVTLRRLDERGLVARVYRGQYIALEATP